ncbi:MAG: CHAP domain-containing protein [Erysipelotrichaceae bacterium]|nr:CHAP domain-containing protein [Erysipelotrichaceae bacterium]
MKLLLKLLITIIILSSVFFVAYRSFQLTSKPKTTQGRLIAYSQSEVQKSPFEEYIDLVIEIANSQPQYPVVDGITIYGERFGNPTFQWCTEFVMYCLEQAEIELNTTYIDDIYPWKDSAYAVGLWYKKENRYFTAGNYTPIKGDIILFDTSKNGYPDHTGLVIGTVHQYGIDFVLTIEGNIPNDVTPQIRIRQLPLDHPDIFAYGSCFTEIDYQGPLSYY